MACPRGRPRGLRAVHTHAHACTPVQHTRWADVAPHVSGVQRPEHSSFILVHGGGNGFTRKVHQERPPFEVKKGIWSEWPEPWPGQVSSSAFRVQSRRLPPGCPPAPARSIRTHAWAGQMPLGALGRARSASPLEKPQSARAQGGAPCFHACLLPDGGPKKGTRSQPGRPTCLLRVWSRCVRGGPGQGSEGGGHARASGQTMGARWDSRGGPGTDSVLSVPDRPRAWCQDHLSGVTHLPLCRPQPWAAPWEGGGRQAPSCSASPNPRVPTRLETLLPWPEGRPDARITGPAAKSRAVKGTGQASPGGDQAGRTRALGAPGGSRRTSAGDRGPPRVRPHHDLLGSAAEPCRRRRVWPLLPGPKTSAFGTSPRTSQDRHTSLPSVRCCRRDLQ